MRLLDCLFHFHCGQASRSNEHVFPAALGGRRTDRRLICGSCQKGWTSKLDEVLPSQLRHLNLHLGVVSAHTEKTARIATVDPVTGRRLLINDRMMVDGQGVGLVAEQTDETGHTVQHYQFMSEVEERDVLHALREKGLKPEVLNRTATPMLRTKPLSIGLEFGGRDALRATARIALNFLATREPDEARSSSLEPFKRWVLGEQADGNTFAHYGAALPPPLGELNQYEFGHRIAIGLDPRDGVFARVSFFDAFELAIRLSPKASGQRRYYVWDVDPAAQGASPGIDQCERSLDGVLEHSPRVLGEFATSSTEIFDKVEAQHNRILESSRARIDKQHAERLSQQLLALGNVAPERLSGRAGRLMESQLQCATNLLAKVAPVLEGEIRKEGYASAADHLHALMDREDAEFTVPLSKRILEEMTNLVVELVKRDQLSAESVHEVLFGLPGLRAAYLALFRTLKPMRIWYKT